MKLKYFLLFWMFAFHLFSNAQNWLLKDPNGPGYIYSLDITPDSSIWATFYYGKTGLYHSNDYGKNWSIDTSIKDLLGVVSFYNDDYGLVGGFERRSPTKNAKIYHTENGGNTWSESILPNGVFDITSIQYVDSSTAYAFTAYGQIIWTFSFASIWGIYHTFPLNSMLFDSHVFGEDHMLVASNKLHLKTKDNPWDTVFTDPIYDIDFLNDSIGFAIGDSVVIKTINSGREWRVLSNYKIPFKNNLQSIFELHSINALSEKEIYIALENKIYRSIDSGITWQQDYLLDSNQLVTSLHQFGNDIWMTGNLGLIRKRNSTLINVPEIDKIENEPLFYPNPFYSTLKSMKLFDELKIYNQSGLIVYEDKVNISDLIDLSNLPIGIYIAVGVNGNKRFHQKLIKASE